MDSENDQFIQELSIYWTCPISQAQFREPVVTSDGHSYEKEGIEHWLETKNKSPVTGLPLENKTLVPNLTFKNLIVKLNAELPAFLEKEESLKTEIDQLKEEIIFLKRELKFEKQKNEELLEKEENEFKTKKIEKQRHEQKFEQLGIIRDQKNKYQNHLQTLRFKEQQQNRQIAQLKEELRETTRRFQEASKGEKQYREKYEKVFKNREQIKERLEIAFYSNLKCLTHFLHSIQQANKFELEREKNNASRQTIAVEEGIQNANRRQNHRKLIIEELESILKDTFDFTDRNLVRQYSRTILRNYSRRQFYRQQMREYPQARTNNVQDEIMDEIMSQHHQDLRIQRVNRRAQRQSMNPEPQGQQQGQQENEQPRAQNPIVLVPANLLPQGNLMLPEQANRFQLRPNGSNGSSYKQLECIRWMMSKRNFRQIPQFYNYQFCPDNNDPETEWFGIRLRVLESMIPFNQFLDFSWTQVRWLDISSCNIDDSLWQRFLENAEKFNYLSFINACRNNIETVRKSDIEKFPGLKRLTLLRNKLTQTSKNEIQKYVVENQHVRIAYDIDGMDQSLAMWMINRFGGQNGGNQRQNGGFTQEIFENLI